MRAPSLIAAAVIAAAAPACKPSKPVTEDEKTLYAVGMSFGQQLRVLDLTEAELAMVERGLEDQVLKRKPEVEMKDYAPKMGPMVRARAQKQSDAEKQKGAAYAAQMEKEPGAQKLPSGVIYIEQQAGTGEQPNPSSVVKVNYRGTLVDGTEFDSSYKRNAPADFPLNGVVRCWGEGLPKMKVGGKAKLICPSNMAYGDHGDPRGAIPGGATLTFEVELLEVKAAPPPPPMPPPPSGPLGGPGAPPVTGAPPGAFKPAPPAAPPPAKTPPPLPPGPPVPK